MNRLSSLRATRAPMPSMPIRIFLPNCQKPIANGGWPTGTDSDARRDEFPCSPLTASYSPALSRRLLRPGFRSLGHGLGRGQDSLDDIVVAGAAADIAFEFGPDRRLVQSLRVTTDHVGG